MKRIIQTAVLAAFVAGAQSVWADDSYESQQKIHNVMVKSYGSDTSAGRIASSTSSGFPASGDDFVAVTPQWTGVDRANMNQSAINVFPASGDDGLSLQPRETYADRHKDSDQRLASASKNIAG